MAKRKPKLTDVQNKQLSDVKQAYRREKDENHAWIPAVCLFWNKWIRAAISRAAW